MPPPLDPALVAQHLRAGDTVPEGAFDQFLPPRSRALANQHWTPLAVIRRVARWLEELEIESVVDVGSGAGKFCVAAALSAPHCRFVGIEHRRWLTAAARDLARVFNVEDRVEFIDGAVGEIAVPRAAAVYLYNPFGENMVDGNDHIDEEVELTGARYQRDIATVARLLNALPTGTFVINYNGYGGKMPRSYEVVRDDVDLSYPLRVWRKR